MLHMPVSEEDRELLEKLKKMADSIEPPASLSPEQIKNRLPDRKTIPFSRRIAPYAAAAACLAVVLTGTSLFLKNQETASDSLRMEKATQTASATDDASSEAAIAEADTPPEGNNALGKENTILYSADAQEDMVAEKSASSYEAIYEVITEAYTDNAVQDKRNLSVTAAMATPSATVDGTEYLLSGSQQLRAASADGTAQTIELELPEGWIIQYLTEAEGYLGVIGEIPEENQTFAVCYDVTEPMEPVQTTSVVQNGIMEGVSVSSDGTMLLLSEWTPSDPGDGSDPAAFIPAVDSGAGEELLLPEEILLGEGSGYLVATVTEPASGTIVGKIACYGVSEKDGFTTDGFQWDGSLFRWENGSFVQTDL